MAYSKSANRASMKYVAEYQKRIEIKYKKTEYEERILPAVKESGLPLATFIKQAIDEKIARERKTTD